MKTLKTWNSVTDYPVLDDESMHVWRIPINSFSSRAFDMLPMLSEEEQRRAARFSIERPWLDYITMRFSLRMILSRYLKQPSEQIEIEILEHGKPRLRKGGLYFNLSHAGDLGLIAVTPLAEVGVDIERIDRKHATHEIAERFFSPAENRALAAYDDEEKVRAFFRCWSRKEAVIKALGEGLSCPLSSFDVSIDEDRAELLEWRREHINTEDWSMVHIETNPSYTAAAAVMGACRDVQGYIFS